MLNKNRLKGLAVSLLMLVSMVTLALYLDKNSHLKRLDYVIYDLLLPLQADKINQQILIVAIDDNSLIELGRWPWSRLRHAQLLNILTEMKAKAVGFDILFSEPQLDDTQADNALANAIRNNQHTILALAPTKQNDNDLITELLPVADLALEAASLGHVDIELDADGLCRSAYLYAGIGNAHWPSFALTLFTTGGNPAPSQVETRTQSTDGWVRKDKILIPFTGPEKSARIVSFSDLLAGRVDASVVEGKYVLIGAMATGLGDAISTPGTFSHQRMPGIELHAQILNGLLQDKLIQELAAGKQVALTSVLVAISIIAILLSPLRLGVITSLLGITTVILVSAALLVFNQSWFSPAGAILAIFLAWPLWSIWQFSLEKQLRHQLLQQLDHQARYHHASGLPNHSMLEDRLRSLPELQANSSQLAGLMVVHINWPGSASVVLDRPIGDPILKTIADRLRSLTAQDDYIAHLSGDDFAILSSGFNNSEEISQAALDLISKLQEPLQHEDEKLLLAPQMGVSIWPTDTQDAKSLLRNAYTAMFKSRIDETEHLNLYSSSIGQELKTRSELEQALISALENNEFQLYYQPQVNATDGRIIGFEALLRWHNEKLGWVGPDVFIPVAEHVGLITPIGEWVMETGFRQLQNWQEAGLGPLRLAINVSPLQFMLPEIDTCIQEKIEETGIEPGDIELEITEGSLMHDINTAVKVMKNIKQYGVELAIDDFGTGYSSLSSLRHFPLDRLKIDQSFTREIGVVNEATEITLTILAMAKQLNLSVIAEGVETQDQADFLRQNGCDEFQGYLYGRPASAAETTLLLHASKA